ncbi:MAG: PAS domain S-box protein, partial [bacterium]
MKDQEKSKQQLIKELKTLRKQIKDAQEIAGDKELFRLMIQQMPAVLWTTDKTLKFTASLGAGLSALNLKANQVVNMTLYEYFQTRDATFLPIAAHLKALQGKSISYEFEWQNNTYQAHVEPLRDIAGQIIGTIGIAHDITVRKHAVEALQESEERFRQLIERVPDGIYSSTPEGKLLAVNSALVKMLGYESKEKLLKLDISKDLYFNPEERQGVLSKFRKDAIASNIFRLKKKDGNELWVEDHVQPIYNSKGQLLYYDGVLRDITKRKQAEEALRESEKHYRLFFEEDLSGNFISTPDGKLLTCNPAFVRMLGFDSVKEALHTDMFN